MDKQYGSAADTSSHDVKKAEGAPCCRTRHKRPSNRGCLAGQRPLRMVLAMFKLTLEVSVTKRCFRQLVKLAMLLLVVYLNK